MKIPARDLYHMFMTASKCCNLWGEINELDKQDWEVFANMLQSRLDEMKG